MLIVAGTLTFAPDKLDAVIALQGPLMEEVRAEAGCQTYVFSNDAQTPGVQHLFETGTTRPHWPRTRERHTWRPTEKRCRS